jgi:hypothetical protein
MANGSACGPLTAVQFSYFIFFVFGSGTTMEEEKEEDVSFSFVRMKIARFECVMRTIF